MKKSEWKQRFASLSMDGWELTSGEEQHRKHPDSFWIPDKKTRDNLRFGQAAKLLFRIEGTDEQGQIQEGTERMWVLVTGKKEDRYIGILDNQPTLIEEGYLDRGTEILFRAEHVIDVETPPLEYLKERHGDRLQLDTADKLH